MMCQNPQKPQFLSLESVVFIKNCGFQPKTMAFDLGFTHNVSKPTITVVFLGQKPWFLTLESMVFIKTMVFGQKLQFLQDYVWFLSLKLESF